MRIIENQTFDMERALYGSEGVLVKSCSFDGPADGESMLIATVRKPICFSAWKSLLVFLI